MVSRFPVALTHIGLVSQVIEKAASPLELKFPTRLNVRLVEYLLSETHSAQHSEWHQVAGQVFVLGMGQSSQIDCGKHFSCIAQCMWFVVAQACCYVAWLGRT